jgi:hypothetical protein
VALLWVEWTTAVSIAVASLSGPAELPRNRHWSGEVKPDAAWLTRQGVAAAYPIRFTINETGHVAGLILFTGGANPAAGGQGVLDGQLGTEALNLTATVDAPAEVAPALRPQARVTVTLTGYVAADGSLEGVGLLNMGDLGCLADPAGAAARVACPRRMVPIKWTATIAEATK